MHFSCCHNLVMLRSNDSQFANKNKQNQRNLSRSQQCSARSGKPRARTPVRTTPLPDRKASSNSRGREHTTSRLPQELPSPLGVLDRKKRASPGAAAAACRSRSKGSRGSHMRTCYKPSRPSTTQGSMPSSSSMSTTIPEPAAASAAFSVPLLPPSRTAQAISSPSSSSPFPP